MDTIVELRLKPETLNELGLPDIGYPIDRNELDAISGTGQLPLALLLFGLQQRSAQASSDWQKLEGAMDRLAYLLTPDDDSLSVVGSGDNWEVEVEPVNLNRKIVAIQRGTHLIAAIAPTATGSLRVAAYRPLDAKSAQFLVSLSQVPTPPYGVQMRENNWELTLDAAAATGNAYAADRGEAYLSYWEKGMGISSDDAILPVWRAQSDLSPRRAASVAAEIGTFYTFTEGE